MHFNKKFIVLLLSLYSSIALSDFVPGGVGSPATFANGITVTGKADLSGGVIQSGTVFSTSSDYVITDTDGYSLILVTVGATDKNITLPNPATNDGRVITIKRVDAGTSGQVGINILGTIDGFTNTKIGQRANNTYNGEDAYLTVKSDATEWQIIGTGNDYLYISSTTAWSSSPFDAASLSIPPGRWLIYCFSYRSGGSSDTNISISISSSATTLNNSIGKRSYSFFSSTTTVGSTQVTTIEDVETTTTFYAVGIAGNVTGLASSEHSMYAVRL